MARPLRMDYEGAWYHVMNRGIERREIFLNDDDRRGFVRLLSEMEEEFGVEVHAYCLMSNHYHIALHTREANLSRAMRWLGQSYTQGFNRREHRVGPLFQGRFKSVPVEPEEWLTQLSIYIHLNPLHITRLGLGKAEEKRESRGVGKAPDVKEVNRRLGELRAYPWSSYRYYGGYRTTPEWLKTETILSRFGRELKAQRAGYRSLLRDQLKRGTEESRFERIREEVAIGSAAFVEQLKSKFIVGMSRETAGKKAMARTVTLEEIIARVEEMRGAAKEEWLNQHGDEGKWMILKLARHRCGMTLRELGEAIGGMDYAAVSMGIRRYEKRLERNKDKKRRFDRVAKKLEVKT